jgi:hypothetical protein
LGVTLLAEEDELATVAIKLMIEEGGVVGDGVPKVEGQLGVA